MKYSFFILLSMVMVNPPQLLFDFGSKNTTDNWYIVNDDVMGGRSTSTLQETDNSIRFEGSISLENNGGFASIRSPRKSYDLSSYKTVSIRFRSTGRDFGIVLERYRRFYLPTHKLIFGSDTNEWTTISFPVSTFKTQILGADTGNFIDTETLKNIERIGIILFDKKEGEFAVEIDYIRFE